MKFAEVTYTSLLSKTRAFLLAYFSFIPQRRVSLHCGSYWLEWLSFPCIIVSGILPPYEPWCLFGGTGWADGRTGGAYFSFQKFLGEKRGIFFSFF